MEGSDVLVTLPDHTGYWTVDDYLALPETKLRIEIQDGCLLVSPPPGRPHQHAAARLMRVLADQVEPELTVVAERDVVLNHTSVRIPDLNVVPTSTWASGTGALRPEETLVAVEIVSPNSRSTDRVIKPTEYAAAGILGFWRIELEPELSLSAFVLDAGTYVEVGTWDSDETAHITAPIDVWVPLPELAWPPTVG